MAAFRVLVRCTLRPDDHQPSSSRETRQGACPSGEVYANSSARGATARTFPRELLQDRSHSRTTGEVYSEGGKGAQRTAVELSPRPRDICVVHDRTMPYREGHSEKHKPSRRRLDTSAVVTCAQSQAPSRWTGSVPRPRSIAETSTPAKIGRSSSTVRSTQGRLGVDVQSASQILPDLYYT